VKLSLFQFFLYIAKQLKGALNYFL